MLPDPDLGFDSQHSRKISEEKIVDIADGYQWSCFEESGQWLENVVLTHLVLASGKLVLQKRKLMINYKPIQSELDFKRSRPLDIV